jgi:hypothetical protein
LKLRWIISSQRPVEARVATFRKPQGKTLKDIK